MKNSLNMAVIGLGNRGKSLLEQVLVNQDDINIVALCDVYGDRVEAAVKSVEERKGNTPLAQPTIKRFLRLKTLMQYSLQPHGKHIWRLLFTQWKRE